MKPILAAMIEGEKGRSLEEKAPVAIALKIRGTLFEKHIDSEALIKTDKWRGYLPLKEAYPNLE